ncbi:MAG: hypothetical protein KDK70_30490 [Myxococcales bacterium]|nr:hypothetical protein [Myxococcales bacterium]
MAQPYVTKTGMVVDPSRFKRNGETLLFLPFVVERTQPLADALAQERIPADMDMLVAIRDDRVIALSRTQMAYHHVAQSTKDEPWLVFF